MTATVAVIIDYQNIHLTAHDCFAPPGTPKHETLIHPLLFAEQVMKRRRAALTPQWIAGVSDLPPIGELAHVAVYRGAPANQHDCVAYSRAQAQRSEWTRDPRVKVTYRTLRYQWDSTVGDWSKQEKGVDVLTALDAYRKAVQGTYDVVILASHDTDLIPVLETYNTDRNENSGRLETTGWQGCNRLKAREVTTWDTRLDAKAFVLSRDRRNYT